jgi:hypothetical protein
MHTKEAESRKQVQSLDESCLLCGLHSKDENSENIPMCFEVYHRDGVDGRV